MPSYPLRKSKLRLTLNKCINLLDKKLISSIKVLATILIQETFSLKNIKIEFCCVSIQWVIKYEI